MRWCYLYRYEGGHLASIGSIGEGSTKQLPAGLYYVKAYGSVGSYDFTVTGDRVGPDSVGPKTVGAPASGTRGRAIALRYSVADISPQAVAVRVVVKDAAGKTAQSFALGDQPTNVWLVVQWTPKTSGVYRYFVYAKDLAGNAQRKVGSGAVNVR